MDYGRPWARTLIRIDHKVSPIFHKPPETHDSELNMFVMDYLQNRFPLPCFIGDSTLGGLRLRGTWTFGGTCRTLSYLTRY